MARHPRTGMERLLRLRDVQIAQARQESGAAESALRSAQQRTSAAHGAVAAFADARHGAHSSPLLDLQRYGQLIDGEIAAEGYRLHCEAEAMQRRREAEHAAERLHARLRQHKSVEHRHESLRTCLQQALDSKLDGQLCDLWQITREAS